eukprot:scaffold3165_cov380-Prasinococcus_capsulatus_cf.AAC.1
MVRIKCERVLQCFLGCPALKSIRGYPTSALFFYVLDLTIVLAVRHSTIQLFSKSTASQTLATSRCSILCSAQTDAFRAANSKSLRFQWALMDERVVGGARKFSFGCLLASTTLSVSPDRRRSVQTPCGSRLLPLMRSVVGAHRPRVVPGSGVVGPSG